MSKTTIAWTDYTLNFWEGCTKVSAGCAHCYAAERDKRHMIEPVDHWGKGAPRRRVKGAAENALAWNKRPWICDVCGRPSDKHYDHSCTGRKEDACHTDNVTWHRARVFLGSLMDIFDDEISIEWFAGAMDVVRQCTELDFLLVTKRPELFQVRTLEAALWSAGYRDGQLFDIPIAKTRDELTEFLGGWSKLELTPPNVWVITSTENQEMLEKRVPELLIIPAVVHGLSCEPLLGPVDLTLGRNVPKEYQQINWVIAGGESGPGARPMKVEWMSDIQRQCQEAGVPYFAKQLGANVTSDIRDEIENVAATVTYKHKDKKGGDMAEWPEEMCVRQWPEGRR